MPARSVRWRIVLAMFLPVCFFFIRWNPIKAAFKYNFESWMPIQCAVTARNALKLALDQMSAVRLIRPREFYRWCLAVISFHKTVTYRKLNLQFFKLDPKLLDDGLAKFVTAWDVIIRESIP